MECLEEQGPVGYLEKHFGHFDLINCYGLTWERQVTGNTFTVGLNNTVNTPDKCYQLNYISFNFSRIPLISPHVAMGYNTVERVPKPSLNHDIPKNP